MLFPVARWIRSARSLTPPPVSVCSWSGGQHMLNAESGIGAGQIGGHVPALTGRKGTRKRRARSRRTQAERRAASEGRLLALADYLVERFRSRLFEPALDDRQGLPALLIWLQVYVDSLRGPELQVRAACVLLGEALGSEPAFLSAINRVHRNVRAVVE